MGEEPDGAGVSERQARRHRKLAVEYAIQAGQRLDGAENASDVYNLVELFASREEWAAGLEFVRAAIGQFPALKATLELEMATLLRELGRNDEALEVLRRAAGYRVPKPSFLLGLGRQFLELGRLEEAVPVFGDALKLCEQLGVTTPGVAAELYRIRLTLGYLWLRLDDPRRTLALLEPLSDLPPAGLLLASQAHYRLHDLPRAKHFLARADEAARKTDADGFFDIDYYLYAASVYEEAGDFSDAVASAEKALAVNPQGPLAANFLGYILADHNVRLAEAEKLITLAVRAEPQNVAYLDSLAWVHFRLRRYAEALGEINQALRLSDGAPDPVILDHAGDIYEANGYSRLALRYWWGALEAGAKKPDPVRAKIARYAPAGAP
jgi:tetratricopeptide (TPR) repeat protein